MKITGSENERGVIYKISWLTVVFVIISISSGYTQRHHKIPPDVLKKLSLEELMNMEVISVTKSPQQLTEVASAIQVITSQDLYRSAATRLPEALRLAPNLQVAQSNSHDWAITSRGFNAAPLANNTLANKLLVMIDGRSVYTPLFGGVFWDVQNVLLEDIDRIEVVSGPGGTLWGENAVNGVINVITKNAKETQGLYISGAGGSFLKTWFGSRYGGKIGKKMFFRIYGQHFNEDNSIAADGSDNDDEWSLSQGGFRIDYYPSQKNSILVEGNVYGGNEGDSQVSFDGQNILSRWTHAFSDSSNLNLQIYFDRTWKFLPNADFAEDLMTYDVDFQHHLVKNKYLNLTWGIGYRLLDDNINNSAQLSFFPRYKSFSLFSAFVHDRITLLPQKLQFITGAKFTHNEFSGFGVQPSVRLLYTPNDVNSIWTAVTCAIRTPSRVDSDISTPSIIGSKDFESEKLMAYEFGYRTRPAKNISLSLAIFFNHYNDLRSINTNIDSPPDFIFTNDQNAESWGIELSGNYQLNSWWRLRGGYTYLNKNIWAKTGFVVKGSSYFEALDPENQMLLHSIMDFPEDFHLDVIGRFIDRLPGLTITPAVRDYYNLDIRLTKGFGNIVLSIAGQNLCNEQNSEFGAAKIPRNIYGQLTWRFN